MVGRRRANAGVVGDLVRIVQRDVEVGSDDDALVSQHDIVDRLFTQSHCGSIKSVLQERRVNGEQNRAEAGIDPQCSASCLFAAMTLIRSRTRHE